MKNIYLFYSIVFSIFSCLLSTQDNNKNIYLVALAGGTGERLWPLSKRKTPKQFLSLDGKQSMLEDTLDRLELVNPNAHIWTVTTEEFEEKVQNLCGSRLDNILVEPDRRDTAPAILYTCLKIAVENPNAIVAFVPTDHYIPEKKRFAKFLRKALSHAALSSDITLLGVTPRYPATGYGYICYDKNKQCDMIAPLVGFYEKPNAELAQKYIAKENTLWNTGVFCGTVQSFLDAYRQFAPEVYETMMAVVDGQKDYSDNPKISVDYAIMEKISTRAVIPADIIWSDVGDLKTFLSLQANDNNEMILLDSANNLVYSNKLVALIGVDNLCVVETDGEILIVPSEKVQQVRQLVALLKSDRKYQALI